MVPYYALSSYAPTCALLTGAPVAQLNALGAGLGSLHELARCEL